MKDKHLVWHTHLWFNSTDFVIVKQEAVETESDLLSEEVCQMNTINHNYLSPCQQNNVNVVFCVYIFG